MAADNRMGGGFCQGCGALSDSLDLGLRDEELQNFSREYCNRRISL